MIPYLDPHQLETIARWAKDGISQMLIREPADALSAGAERAGMTFSHEKFYKLAGLDILPWKRHNATRYSDIPEGVHPKDRVLVKLRDPHERPIYSRHADAWSWHICGPSTIIAYRVIEPHVEGTEAAPPELFDEPAVPVRTLHLRPFRSESSFTRIRWPGRTWLMRRGMFSPRHYK